MSDHGSDSSSGSTGSAETGTPAGSAENTAAASRDSTAANDNSSQNYSSEGQGSTQPTTQRADVSRAKEAESKAGRGVTQATESVGDAVAASNAAKTSADRDFFRGAADAAQMAATKARREEQRAQSQQNQKELRTLRSKSRPHQTIDNSKFFGKVKEARERGQEDRREKRENKAKTGRPEISGPKSSRSKLEGHKERPDTTDNRLPRDNAGQPNDDGVQKAKARNDTRPDVGAKDNTTPSAQGEQSATIKLNAVEKAERNKTGVGDDRFFFEYDQSKATATVADAWGRTVDNLGDKLFNPDFLIFLHSYRSSPGSLEYNKNLAEEAAIEVRDYLIKNGVDVSRIKIVVHGENPDPNYGEQDHADDRVVIPQFYKNKQEPKEPGFEETRKDELKQDLAIGKGTFLNLIQPIVDFIKEKHHMPKKEGGGDPSADPEKFIRQVKQVGDDAKKVINYKKNPLEAGKTIAKWGKDFFNETFANGKAKDVNEARQLLYDVTIEALTSACFPEYKPDLSSYSDMERKIFDAVYEDTHRLSDLQRYQIRAYVIVGITRGEALPPSHYFETHMNEASSFKHGVKNFFQSSEYRYRD